ncbi:hypothetical protein, partial [Stenotrophomonas maltophilia]|uniref:hypothetical protein n=2 Tax=Stenotrophomonas maltophilia TaxID=40324 RepID=UPI002449C494
NKKQKQKERPGGRSVEGPAMTASTASWGSRQTRPFRACAGQGEKLQERHPVHGAHSRPANLARK